MRQTSKGKIINGIDQCIYLANIAQEKYRHKYGNQNRRLSHIKNLLQNSIKIIDIISESNSTSSLESHVDTMTDELNTLANLEDNFEKEHIMLITTKIEAIAEDIYANAKIIQQDEQHNFELKTATFNDFKNMIDTETAKINSLTMTCKRDIADVTAELKSISKYFENEKQRVTLITNEIQSSLIEKQRVASEEYQKTIDSLSRQTKIFLNSIEERHKTDKENFTNEANDIVNKIKNLLNKTEYETKTRSSEIIETISSYRTQAEQIVGLISEAGMSSRFCETANKERDSSRFWKFIASMALGTWAMFGLIIYFTNNGTSIEWAAVVRQILISTPFLLLAGFSTLQTSKHKRNEIINRQYELELASLDAFISTIPEQERVKIKQDLVSKYFGNNTFVGNMSSEKSDAESMVVMLKEVHKAVPLPKLMKLLKDKKQ
ncbi:MAG: hypothetical protein ACOZEN_04545 [Thermodesulfobacteriota bacterium]